MAARPKPLRVAASTADILGTKQEPHAKEESEVLPEPVITVDGEPVLAAANAAAPVAPLPKPRIAAKKKPISVASTPLIGNYQLPSLDLLNHPEPNLVPSETKEQLMERARLMQQTLAQFDIEVQLGDITKGPTITRYEFRVAGRRHPCGRAGDDRAFPRRSRAGLSAA